jgi:hypothetical protein
MGPGGTRTWQEAAGNPVPAMRRPAIRRTGLRLSAGHLPGRRSPHPRPPDVYALNVKCSDDWPGLIDAAKSAMAAVMPASSVFCVRRPGCTEVKSTSKHWPCLFPQHGLGRKHERTIELTAWQGEIVTRYPGLFARGLFHSDGCRVTNRVRRRLADGEHWYEYPRYLFSNESTDILGLCGQALDQLGISWRLARRNVLSVARREAVARLDEFVGRSTEPGHVPSVDPRAGSGDTGGSGPGGRRSGRGTPRPRLRRSCAWPWSQPAGWSPSARWS